MWITLELGSMVQLGSNGRKDDTYPNLIRPTRLRKISNPFDAVVIALLEDFQEAHNQTRRRKHQHLKVNVNRGPCPYLSMGCARQLSGCGQRYLLAALNPRNPTAGNMDKRISRSTERQRTSRRQRSRQVHTSLYRSAPCSLL